MWAVWLSQKPGAMVGHKYAFNGISVTKAIGLAVGVPVLLNFLPGNRQRWLSRQRIGRRRGFGLLLFRFLGLFVATHVVAFGHGRSFQYAAIECRDGGAWLRVVLRSLLRGGQGSDV